MSAVSNCAKLSDGEAVHQILHGYRSLVDIEVIPDAKWATTATLRIADSDEWLLAVKRELLPDPNSFESKEGLADAELQVLFDHGNDGFIELLRELSPHLEQTLVVMAFDEDEESHPAMRWTVEPGSRKVMVQEFFTADKFSREL